MSAKGQLVEFFSEANKIPWSSKNVEAQLYELQFEQFKHDEKYHKEICSLSVQNRINHMSLHFAKYTGQISEMVYFGESIEESDGLKRTIIDIFVIATILANILNKKLSDGIENIELKEVNSLKELGLQLAKMGNIKQEGISWFLNSIAIANGKIAKACEKLDHMEAYPFREEIFKGLTHIFKSTLIVASQLNYDLPILVRKRLIEIEERSVFYEKLK